MSDNTCIAGASWKKRGRKHEFKFFFRTRGREQVIEITAGGARRDRTDDLLLAKQALSQLSYGPALAVTPALQREMVGLGRLELPTSRLSSARSNQLSYRPNLQAHTHDPRANHPRFAGKRMLHRPWVTAWARPRRKRNEDGEVPPMDLTGLNRSALMFPRDPIETKRMLRSEGSSLERR
jgi:hypothetical protein